jgi:flavodoxin
MGNIIFYFSGTGNCLKVAKAIADELGNCEIVSMAKPFDGKKIRPYRFRLSDLLLGVA